MLLNEGLQTLGAKEIVGEWKYEGRAFAGSTLASIKLPSTLKRIEACTFSSCNCLKNIEFPCGVEYIGRACFSNSGIYGITLPSTLREVDENAFEDCYVGAVWVEDGCKVNVRKYAGKSVKVLPVSQTMVGGQRL